MARLKVIMKDGKPEVSSPEKKATIWDPGSRKTTEPEQEALARTTSYEAGLKERKYEEENPVGRSREGEPVPFYFTARSDRVKGPELSKEEEKRMEGLMRKAREIAAIKFNVDPKEIGVGQMDDLNAHQNYEKKTSGSVFGHGSIMAINAGGKTYKAIYSNGELDFVPVSIPNRDVSWNWEM